MKIVVENAEEEIRQLVEEMEKHPVAWRAIHCLWKNASKHHLQDLSYKLKASLGEDDSYLFCWGGEDIFIISKGTRREPLEQARQLVQNFCGKAQGLEVDEINNFKTVAYDLSIAWQEFRDFFSFREKEIAKKEEVVEDDERFKSIRREEKDDVRLIHMDFSEKKVELQRRAMRPGVTILAVDGDTSTLNLLSSICKGYKVIKAMDGQEALTRYFDEAPDIVIMDTQLPLVNGWDVVQHIYENDPQAFVIMVTAKTDEAEVQRAIKYGVKGFVKKPFSQGKVEQYLSRFKEGAPLHKRVQI